MSELTEHEVIIRMVEGLKQSADAARMLGVMQRNSDFLGVSQIILEISKNASRLATSKAMSKQVLDAALNRHSAVLATH